MFTNGRIEKIPFVNGDEKGPRKGYNWLILYGIISHTTGTATQATIRSGYQGMGPQKYIGWLAVIPAATGTARYTLFSTEPDSLQSQYGPYILLGSDGDYIDFDGDTDALMNLTVLEWEP